MDYTFPLFIINQLKVKVVLAVVAEMAGIIVRNIRVVSNVLFTICHATYEV